MFSSVSKKLRAIILKEIKISENNILKKWPETEDIYCKLWIAVWNFKVISGPWKNLYFDSGRKWQKQQKASKGCAGECLRWCGGLPALGLQKTDRTNPIKQHLARLWAFYQLSVLYSRWHLKPLKTQEPLSLVHLPTPGPSCLHCLPTLSVRVLQ